MNPMNKTSAKNLWGNCALINRSYVHVCPIIFFKEIVN